MPPAGSNRQPVDEELPKPTGRTESGWRALCFPPVARCRARSEERLPVRKAPRPDNKDELISFVSVRRCRASINIDPDGNRLGIHKRDG
jgi:hypothetical protein